MAEVITATRSVALDPGRSMRGALTAATVVPWLTLIVDHHLTGYALPFVLISAFGVLHVGTTAAFYADPELWSILGRNPMRYVVAPMATITGCVAVVLLAPRQGVIVGLIGIGAWRIHHFTRQNLGCFAFYCRSKGEGGPTAAERRTFDLTGWAGMCGAVQVFPPDAVPDLAATGLRALGVALLCVAAARVGTAEVPAWRRAAMAAAVLFYAPLFLYSGSLTMAAATYASAHAVQYYVMMGHMAAGRTPRMRAWMVLALAVGFVGVGIGLQVMSGASFTGADRWIAGFYTGVVASHFIVDAGIWKMRDPDQRAFMQRRFAFL